MAKGVEVFRHLPVWNGKMTDTKALNGGLQGKHKRKGVREGERGKSDGTQGMTAWSPGNPSGNKIQIKTVVRFVRKIKIHF